MYKMEWIVLLIRRATENYLPDKVRLNQRSRCSRGRLDSSNDAKMGHICRGIAGA